MKKHLAFLTAILAIIIVLAGCAHGIDWVICNEPYFCGTVAEITDEYVVVNVNTDDSLYSTHPVIYASRDVEFSDISSSGIEVGFEVYVYYHGTITGENPSYVENVYGFTY